MWLENLTPKETPIVMQSLAYGELSIVYGVLGVCWGSIEGQDGEFLRGDLDLVGDLYCIDETYLSTNCIFY